MNKYLPPSTKDYDYKSSSNLSLITAGLPSGSIMTPRLIPPSSTTTPNQYFNQNRANDTQPISFNSSKSATDQSHTFSNRTKSDTYLNLSRKDIDDLLAALHTLAQYIHNDTSDESHPSTMPQSKSTNHTIKSSCQTNSPAHYCIKDELSIHPDLAEQCQHQLQCYQNYVHHSPIYYSSGQCSSTKTPPLHMPLSSYILDQLISIDQNQLIPNVQMLPQHAHTFQILQHHRMPSFMSIDSLNIKDRFRTILRPYSSHKTNQNQTFNMDDQLTSKKIDAATQWSLPMHDSTQTKSTIATNNSAINIACVPNQSITKTNDKYELTKSETARFLTSYQCLDKKQLSMDDTSTNISINNSFSQFLTKKKPKSNPIKVVSKRPRYRTSKSPRQPSTIKRIRRQDPSPSNKQLMGIIQSLQTNDLQDDSSFDFFDMDTTFSDPYDRLFSDTTMSEKSIC